jgi:chaperonin GroES
MLFTLDKKLVINKDVMQSQNLCDRFSKEDLQKIGGLVHRGYQSDLTSRSKWQRRMEAGMDLAMQVQKDKSFPWPNCSNVTFPLVTIAAFQFSSRSYNDLISGTEIVKYRVTGIDIDQKLRDQADRISRHMSWQVLEEDTSWEEEHDKLLINLGIVGCNFVKTFYSGRSECQISELVMARDFVLHYKAKSVEECPRKTQVILMDRNTVYERVVTEQFVNVLNEDWFNSIPVSQENTNAEQENRIGVSAPPPDEDTPFRMFEQHRLLDLDGDGYAEPYIVTLEEGSKSVVRIVARWDDENAVDKTDFPGTKSKIRRIKPTEYYTKYGFIPSPDGGIYDVGFGVLLGPLNESVNSAINQLIDAGTLSNGGGGFLGRGVKIRGGVYTMAPGQWKRVDSSGDDLRKNIVPAPIVQPAEVMFKLLGLLIEYTDRLAGTVDTMVGVAPGQNTPAETSRNTLEQGMNSYKGIYKRIWRSMKEEFKKRHQLNASFMPPRKRFGSGDSWITQEDYKTNPDLVIPAADPEIVSDSQRLAQATMMVEHAHAVPGYDIPVVERNFLKAIKVDAIEMFYPGPDKVPPLPNPKAALEQMKLQAKQMEIEFKKWELVQTLQAARSKTQAEIVKLYAEVGKLLAETQTEKVKAKVEAFSAMVDAFKAHSDMMTQQIEAITGGKDAGSKSGGMGSVEGQSGNASPAAVPPQVQNGLNGAMGGGNVPG